MAIDVRGLRVQSLLHLGRRSEAQELAELNLEIELRKAGKGAAGSDRGVS